MSEQRSDHAKIKARTFVALPAGHLSLILLSNSGQVPLAEVNYRVRLSPGNVIDGTTDADGKVQHDEIPVGEYQLSVEGLDTPIYVPATPTDVCDNPVRVTGYMLFTDDDPPDDSDFPDDESDDEIILNEIDDEGWEDM